MLLRWRTVVSRIRLYQLVRHSVVTGLVFGIAGQAITPATIFAASAYSDAVLSDQPAAYWRLDETSGSTAADASGKGHTGWLLGVSGGATGALVNDPDTAFWFGGSASVKDSVPTTIGADFTIEAWVKPSSSNQSAPIVSIGVSSGTRTLSLEGNRFVGKTDLSSAWPSSAVFSNAVDMSVWHHVVFTTQGGTSLQVYVDGSLSGATTIAARPGFTANAVLGWSDATWLTKYTGVLDEVALYPTALSAARVSAHHAVGTGIAPPPPPIPAYQAGVLTDNPQAYWRLGETSGTTVADASGKGHTGSVLGATGGAAGAIVNDPDTAFSFGGSGYIKDSLATTVGADFTIEAWVKPSSSNESAPVVSIGVSNGTRTLSLEGDRFAGKTDLSSAWPSYAVFSSAVDMSVWHHVVFTTQGGTNLQLYVDGSLSGLATIATRQGFTANAILGWSEATWLTKYSGVLDEVALYPTALSAARVSAHYTLGSGRAPAPAPVPIPAPTCTTTLQALVDAAAAGSTVSAPACVFRETVTISKPLKLVGQAGTEIRGSDVWATWNPQGSTWISQLAVPGLPVVSLDSNACDANTNNRCLWPEQVFVDGQALNPVAPGVQPATGQFALVSISDRRVLLGDNPAGHTIEVTTRPRWIVTAADGVTIQSVSMRHAGNSAVAGAVSNDGHSTWTLQGSTLSDAHSADVGLSGGTNLQVLRNDIGRGGLAGLSGGNVNQGVLVQANRIHDNRQAGFSQNWGAGGLKLAQSQGVVIDGNEADHNDGVGLWCDIGCSNVTFSNNRVHHNSWQGINFEVSSGASIHDNALWENGWGKPFWGWGAGIVISSSANAEVFRNTLAWNYAGLSVIWQNRPEAPSLTAVGINVHDNTIVKKTVTGDFSLTYWKNLSLAWLSDTATVMYDPASNNHGTNNLVWYDQPESVSVRFSWNTQYMFLADFALVAGGTGTSYLTTAQMNQTLTAQAMPLIPEH